MNKLNQKRVKLIKTEFLIVLGCAHYYRKVQGTKWKKIGLKRNTFEDWTTGWFTRNRRVKVQNPQRSVADRVAGRQGGHVARWDWLVPPWGAWTGWPSARGPRPWSTVGWLHYPDGVCNLSHWNQIERPWEKGVGGCFPELGPTATAPLPPTRWPPRSSSESRSRPRQTKRKPPGWPARWGEHDRAKIKDGEHVGTTALQRRHYRALGELRIRR